MNAWWSYSLSDFLLFSPQTYYRLFELYHRSIWPAQIPGFALGIAILWLLGSDDRQERWISLILAACWLWVAWGFHWMWYRSINWAAGYFAVGFTLEALLLIRTGTLRNRLQMHSSRPLFRRCGIALFLFALIIQPLIRPVFGRPWVEAELFGVAPDPTVLATLGVLLVVDKKTHWTLLIIPLLWCAVTGATLWAMESSEALVMPSAGILVFGLAAWKT
ncbi:MAG: DUF6064 family protein [Thermodesulfobacteriota bacterium]